VSIPLKPFPTYKWRWLSVQPSEGLLQPPVFLGVLRALQRHEGELYSSMELHEELLRVQRDTGTDINLARTPERNLFRNSGQYWRGTGLIVPIRGEIQLTNLGRSVAAGQITNDEFVALTIRNTVLPNPATYSATEQKNWYDANLRIKPFQIILATMSRLGQNYDIGDAFLSPKELIKVVIPLSGEKRSVLEIAQSVHEFRYGQLDVSDWSDCAPEANDPRLAREFLLFLENFGVCRTSRTAERYEQRFYLNQLLGEEIQPSDDTTFLEDANILDDEVRILRLSEVPVLVERQRVVISAIQRGGQSRFRKEVLGAANGTCLLTGEKTIDVLEAAHIVPVQYSGSDQVGNGFCMRVDIHRLFDGGKIKIDPNGTVTLNDQIKTAVSYANLPRVVDLPSSVEIANVEWRSRYL
jgi:hypothetical protein